MVKTVRVLTFCALAACAATAQPVANAVLNNASYALPGLPNAPIAQGSLMAIFGTGLSTGNMTATSFPLQPNMGGTSVRVTVGGTTVDAPMVYTTPGQIGAILPSNTPVGAGTLRVTVNGQTSGPVNLTVVRSAFGTFTANQAGSGPAAVQNVISNTDQPINALNRPARPGQTLILWGTGLGPTSAAGDVGAVPGDLPIDVEVYVGGRRASVTYKGRSGCCSGIDQIFFVVPEGVEGCYVPVVIKTGDVVSNFSTIAVAASGNACSDPTGYTPQDIQTAQNNGNLRIGTISLSRTNLQMNIPGVGNFAMKQDYGYASFERFTLDQLVRSQGGSSTQGFAVAPGSCALLSYKAEGQDPQPVDPIQATPLDAGNAITVQRSGAPAKQLAKERFGYGAKLGGGGISGLPIPIPGQTNEPDYLEPGQYTISAPGGNGPNAVGQFNVQYTLPQMITWSNQTSISTITRSAGQQVTWTGGDPNSFVYIIGSSFGQNVASTFYCIERTSAGQFNIPSYVLSNLPPSSGDIPGILMVGGVTNPTRFTATGLDAGYITASSMSQQSVTYR
jgi:uncharacterized protein (TIGR03437 family)